MSAKSNISDNIIKLERKLAKIQAVERKKLINENILRLEKNGDISYETVRTHSSPHAPREECITRSVVPTIDPPQNPVNSNLLPNKLPETPMHQENGNLIGDSAVVVAPSIDTAAVAEPPAAMVLTAGDAIAVAGQESSPSAGLSCHDTEKPGNQEGRDALEELLYRALAASKVRRGRPPAFDEHAKGQLVALLSVGMSMRQAAAVLGVSHTTIQKTLKADASLNEEITASRFQAQLQPLACVIREARRSWKAATWLLKYLDAKIATHEETPDERRQRQTRESEEFFARASAPNVKTRKVLG